MATNRITLTTIGANISDPLQLKSNADSYSAVIETPTKAQLLAGFDFTAPLGATIYRLYSTGECTTYFELSCVYSFSILYGALPVNVCDNGTPSIVYSSKEIPNTGDILYKNPDLSNPWNTSGGGAMMFVNPPLYDSEVFAVAIVAGGYEIGEMIGFSGHVCDCVTITPDLGFDTVSYATACTNAVSAPSTYYGNGLTLIAATTLSASPTCSPIMPLSGYYSDGTYWKYWNGTDFTNSGLCGV